MLEIYFKTLYTYIVKMSLKKYLSSFKSDVKFNYVSFDGGKYYINTENRNTFVQNYCDAYNRNEYLYLVECCLYPCKLFIDIDNKDIQDIDYKCIIREISSHFSRHNMVVCLCTQTHGIHLIFNDIMLDSPDRIREIIPDNIMKYIDTSVYCTGLRLIGSRKLNEDRVYLPRYTYRNGKKIETYNLQQLTPQLFELCCIQTIYSKQKHNIPKVCQICSPQGDILQNHFLGKLHAVYSTCKIKKAFMQNNVIYIQTNSKFCLNLNDNHKNNYVYFIIKKNNQDDHELFQKCFCKCNTTVNRQHGYCRNFCSKKMIISRKDYNFIKQYL